MGSISMTPLVGCDFSSSPTLRKPIVMAWGHLYGSVVVLERLEGDTEQAGSTALLIELFVEDMDPQLREVGIGDMIVGKHIGRLAGWHQAKALPKNSGHVRSGEWPL